MPTFVPARLLAVKEVPSGGGWLYEPKFDGYRGLLVSNSRGAGSDVLRLPAKFVRWRLSGPPEA